MNKEELKFYKLTRVTRRDLEEGVWDTEHKGLYSKDGKRLLLYKRPDKDISSGNYDVFKFLPGVEVICDRAFNHGSLLKGFKLPDSIKAIGEDALAHVMHKNEKLVFPKSIEFIGHHALGNSQGIFDVEFEEGFKEVDLGNVLNCNAAITLHIPSTLTSIGENGFGDVSFTKAVHVAKGNKHFCIDNDVLYDYEKTKLLRCPVTKRGELVVPEGITIIGRYAFRYCSVDSNSLTPVLELSVVLPQSLKVIETGAFRHSHLKSLYIGPNVSAIEDDAFESHFIEDIIVSPENPYFESYQGMLIDMRRKKLITISGSYTGQGINHEWFEVKNNVLIDKIRKTALLVTGYSDGHNAYLFPWNDNERKSILNSSMNLNIPEGVEIINSGTFVGCHFDSLSIPEGVTVIGDNAFACMIARSISLPSTLCYLTPSTMYKDEYIPYLEGDFYFHVPNGMKKRLEKLGCLPAYYIIEDNSEEKERNSSQTFTKASEYEFEQYSIATEDDLENSLIDKDLVRYSHDRKRILKFEGFHSRVSMYRVEEGTEIICENATADDRYQFVRSFIVPASVKYIGSCPSSDRLVICNKMAKFAHSIISLRKNDAVYIPCGTWRHYHKELEKARRGKAPQTKGYDDREDYRLVELSRASLIMYLTQQEHIIISIIKSTKLISEYSVCSINGDSRKRFVCYRDAHRIFFLDADDIFSQKDSILKALSVLGFSYEDIKTILEIDTDDIEVNENNKKFLVGKVLASDVYLTWPEDFSDEETGDVVTIMRSEVLYIRGYQLSEEDVKVLIKYNIPSVKVIHDSHSHENDYLIFFYDYKENAAETLSLTTKNAILRTFFPDKKPDLITDKEKGILAYNLTVLVKAIIDDHGDDENQTIPLRTDDDDLHNKVTHEEENLGLLISEYYQQMIDKVRSCESEIDVMPLFADILSFRGLNCFLRSRNVNEKHIKNLVDPIINIIQVE